MSELQKFGERVERKINDEGLVSIGFSWAEGAENLSLEDRAKAANEWLDASDEWSALTDEQKMRRQIKQVYDDLKKIIPLTQTDIKAWIEAGHPEMTDDQRKLNRIFGVLDMAICTLGNWVPR